MDAGRKHHRKRVKGYSQMKTYEFLSSNSYIVNVVVCHKSQKTQSKAKDHPSD